MEAVRARHVSLPTGKRAENRDEIVRDKDRREEREHRWRRDKPCWFYWGTHQCRWSFLLLLKDMHAHCSFWMEGWKQIPECYRITFKRFPTFFSPPSIYIQASTHPRPEQPRFTSLLFIRRNPTPFPKITASWHQKRGQLMRTQAWKLY